MRWEDVEEGQPRLAATARRLLLEPGVVLVGTVRRDGTPRISPVEPFVMDGDLLLSMLWHSLKAADLARDPRILVHSIVTSREGGDGEVKVRGIASREDRPDVLGRYAAAVHSALGWRPEPGRFHLFAVDVDDVAYVRYDGATGDQYVARWPPPREFVRRGTSATTGRPAGAVRRSPDTRVRARRTGPTRRATGTGRCSPRCRSSGRARSPPCRRSASG